MAPVKESFFRSLAATSLALLGTALVSLPARSALAAESDSTEESKEDDGSAKDADDTTKNADEKGEADSQKKDEAEAPAKEKSDEDSLGHGGQFGLRAGVVGGLRMIVRYEKSTFCRDFDPLKSPADQQKFCGHMAPFSLDFGLSFGVADFLEPFVWGRFGLSAEEQTDTNPIVDVGVGVRLYTMSESAIKVFIEPAIALGFEDGGGRVPWSLVEDGYGTELIFHVAAGPQFDFGRHIGLYATGGLTAGVLRSLNASLDLQIGLQGRYP